MRLFAFFMEILPLAAFFIGYEWHGLMVAAAASVVIGAGLMGFAWWRDGRGALFPLYSVALAAIFTALALVMDATIFIKIQPTVFNGMFSLVLVLGWLRGTAMMKRFFGAQFQLDDATWMTLSLRWGLFFGVLAVANEAAWRGLDDGGWVMVKTFVFAPMSALFMLAQLPITLRGRIDP
ncbi:MAG: septation protein IspZ [Alphaproteobacteria bacterium]|nr:septation protein IspZ [Alphaproteobacteria bacterium]